MKSALEKYLERKGHSITCPADVDIEAICDCGLDLARVEFERLKGVITCTRETRAAQKTYYDKGRLQGDLKKAKQWEVALDQRLARLWSEESTPPAVQKVLL